LVEAVVQKPVDPGRPPANGAVPRGRRDRSGGRRL